MKVLYDGVFQTASHRAWDLSLFLWSGDLPDGLLLSHGTVNNLPLVALGSQGWPLVTVKLLLWVPGAAALTHWPRPQLDVCIRTEENANLRIGERQRSTLLCDSKPLASLGESSVSQSDALLNFHSLITSQGDVPQLSHNLPLILHFKHPHKNVSLNQNNHNTSADSRSGK